MKLSQILKQWADFSTSEVRPLFWMLLGPTLIMLTLIASFAFSFDPYLSLITVIGLVASFCFRLSGFSLILMVFVLYFGLQFLFGSNDALLWKMGWGFSFVLGLTISFLAMEELRDYYAKQEKEKEESISNLKVSLHTLEEKNASEKRLFDREQEGMKDELEKAKEEIVSLFNLVEASRLEAEKSFNQNQLLSQESLKHYQKKAALKRTLDEEQGKIITLEQANELLKMEAKKDLKLLNTSRVELYQAQILLDDYITRFKKYREVILEQRGRLKAQASEKPVDKIVAPLEKDSPSKSAPRRLSLILQTLEKNKKKIREIYDQHLHEYRILKNEIEKGKLKLEKVENKGELILLTSEGQKTELQLKDKKKQLEEIKSELVGIEREIFVIKKGLREREVPALAY